MSPNNAEREDKGYSSAWLHHKGRNKHHMEYWIDYAVEKDPGKEHGGMTGMKMPIRYVAEMFIDRISASKNYQKEKYTDRSPIEYFEHGRGHYLMAIKGEKATFSFVKYELLKGKVPYEKKELEKRTEALQ